MTAEEEEQETLFKNLEDAGCDGELVRKCAALSVEHNTAQLLRLLAQHRSALLEAMHVSQKRIDCLDDLVYKLKKEQKH